MVYIMNFYALFQLEKGEQIKGEKGGKLTRLFDLYMGKKKKRKKIKYNKAGRGYVVLHCIYAKALKIREKISTYLF